MPEMSAKRELLCGEIKGKNTKLQYYAGKREKP